MKRRPEALYISIFLMFFISFQQQQGQVKDDLALLQELVGVLTEQESRDSVPPYILDMIGSCTDEGDAIQHGEGIDVLSFLTGVYSEHGYHDAGNWVPKISYSKTSFSYNPYEGELPFYKESDFQMPVKGILTSHYGYRRKFKKFHYGVDMRLNVGDTVRCALPGVVTRTGYAPGGYGRYVVVTHANDLETLYGHLNSSMVTPGQQIQAGEAIGLGGETGNATGPHLHFETRHRGKPLDPESRFKINPLITR